MTFKENTHLTSLAAKQEKRLVKSLGRMDIILFIIAAFISLDTIGSIASRGSQSLFWAIFLVITFMIPNALIMAETGSAFPEEGGPYQWVKFAYGRLPAGIASVLYWITNPLWLGGSLSFIAFDAFSAYLHHVVPASAGEWIFKLAFIWIAIFLAIISLKKGKQIINLAAGAKITLLLLMVITTAIYGFKHGFQHLTLASMSPTISGFMAVAPIILFSYVGFEAPNAASGEMYDAAKDTAPSIRVGALVSALAYVLPVLAILLVVPKKDVGGISGFMGAVATIFSIYGRASTFLLGVAAVLFIFGLLGLGASWMMATDRIQAMAAADGSFMNGWFGEFNERFGTPMRVNILSGWMASIFLIAGMKLVKGDSGAIFTVVLSCAVSTLLVSYLIIIPAVMKLNRSFPEVHRPFVTPGGKRGFQIMGSVVFIYIVLGSLGVLFPGTVEGVLRIEYNFQDTWGLSRGQVEGFTLGTIAFDLVVALVGFALAKNVRKSISAQSEL
ncbi:MAG: APC family permease [Actinomycetes bacterium]